MDYHVGMRSADHLLTKKGWFYDYQKWQDFLLEDFKEIGEVKNLTINLLSSRTRSV